MPAHTLICVHDAESVVFESPPWHPPGTLLAPTWHPPTIAEPCNVDNEGNADHKNRNSHTFFLYGSINSHPYIFCCGIYFRMRFFVPCLVCNCRLQTSLEKFLLQHDLENNWICTRMVGILKCRHCHLIHLHDTKSNGRHHFSILFVCL